MWFSSSSHEEVKSVSPSLALVSETVAAMIQADLKSACILELALLGTWDLHHVNDAQLAS